MKESAEFFAVECLPFDESLIGFSLPLFAEVEHPDRRYAQDIDEYTGKIREFVVIRDVSVRAVPIGSARAVSVGDHSLLGFIFEETVSHVGTSSELAPILRSFIDKYPKRLSIILQIIEVIGTPNERKQARLQMRQHVLDSIGSVSARAFYEGSVLRSAVWTNLLAAVPDAETALRVLKARSRIGASVGHDGTIRLDLSSLSDQDRSLIDEPGVLKKVEEEFSPFAGPFDGIPKSESSALNQARAVTDLLRQVRAAGRQEERIAILARGILEDRATGMSALLQYGRDRGSVASWAMDRFREAFGRGDEVSRRSSDELRIAALVRPLYARTFATQRGLLLYCLAKHLGKWPMVSKEIRSKLRDSRSGFLHLYQRDIEQMLDGGAKI